MFTSCMDSGESGPQQWAGVVKVNDRMGYVTFTDAAGTELIPTNTIPVTLNARMAYIYCQVDEGQDLSTNPKSIKITLLADPTGIDATAITTPKVESSDVTTNAPVGSLSLHQDIQLWPHFSLVKIRLYYQYLSCEKCDYYRRY